MEHSPNNWCDVARYKRKQVISDAVERAVALAEKFGRGDVIPWTRIEEVAFPRDDSHWTAFNHRFRREVRLTRGINMRAKPGVGLELLAVGDDVNLRSEKRRGRASRQLFRDAVELRSIPDTALPAQLRDQKWRRIEHTAAARRKVLFAERAARTLATHPVVTGMYSRPNPAPKPSPTRPPSGS